MGADGIDGKDSRGFVFNLALCLTLTLIFSCGGRGERYVALSDEGETLMVR